MKVIFLKYIDTYYKMKNKMAYKINFKSFMHDMYLNLTIFNYT